MQNKITFIYDYRDGEVWSTPLALVNEFKERGWETQIIKTNDTDLKNWVNSKPQTDIVLFMDWGRFDSQYLNKDLVSAFWIQESADDPQNFERNYPKANCGITDMHSTVRDSLLTHVLKRVQSQTETE